MNLKYNMCLREDFMTLNDFNMFVNVFADVEARRVRRKRRTDKNMHDAVILLEHMFGSLDIAH